MKAIVTGGAGFIGLHLVKKLMSLGWEVTVIDNFSTGDQDKLHALGCMYIEEDVENVTAAMKIKHDVLFHLASPVSVEESFTFPNKYYRQIIGGTANIVNWSLDSGNRDIIIASTAAIYGNDGNLPLTESGEIDPTSPYAKAKHMSELALQEEYETRQFKGSALRLFNVYGEGQRSEGGYLSAVPVFLKQYEAFAPITVTGDGKQTRDFVYVEDVVSACISAYTDTVENGVQILNVASGQETSIMDLAEAFGGEIVHIEERNEPKRSVADITKIKTTLNWQPLTRLLNWVKLIK
jgi:UDP-glucose 4-epimerase|tara:strand:+ start:4430 stop:5311 length:882 start_codon:yes stop_codon:yes gene_type:complete